MVTFTKRSKCIYIHLQVYDYERHIENELTVNLILLWMQGMGDFLNEMAVMMSQTKSNVIVNLVLLLDSFETN